MARKYNYKPVQDLATRSMDRFGREYTFTRVAQGAYDPATGESPETTTTYTSNTVWLNFSRAEIDGTNVQTGDAAPLIDNSTEPKQGDTFIRKGQTWRIIDFETIEPANDVVLYRLQVRRGS